MNSKHPLTTLAIVRFCVLLCLSVNSALADDPITGKWRFFNNTVRELHADGTSSPPGKANDATWTCTTPQSFGQRSYVITYGGGQAYDRLNLRGGSELWGMNGKRPFLTATRVQPIPSSMPSNPAPTQPTRPPSATPAPTDSLTNILTAHEWTWRDTANAKLTGDIVFKSDGSVQHLNSTLQPWRWDLTGDGITIKAQSTGAATVILAKFNPERSEFSGDFPDAQHQLRALRGRLIGGTDPIRPIIAQTVGGGANTTSYGGMVLSKDWLARNTQIKVKELEELEFFAKQAVGNAAPGKEPVPDEIVPQYGLRWLMPLDQAIKLLPPNVSTVPLKAFQNDSFPHGTLMIKCLQLRYFNDLDQQFNLIYLIADAKQQLVGVQFKSQAKGLAQLKYETLETLRAMHPPFPPPPYAPPPYDGSIGPYNDFFNEGTPGAGYQIRFNNNHSLTLVKLGKTHWYLAAPFARCILDIADFHRKNGLVK